MQGNVAAATQNQAMHALVFLYKRVLNKAIKVAVRRAGLTKPIIAHNDVATTMLYTHVLQHGGQGVPSPLDDLGV